MADPRLDGPEILPPTLKEPTNEQSARERFVEQLRQENSTLPHVVSPGDAGVKVGQALGAKVADVMITNCFPIHDVEEDINKVDKLPKGFFVPTDKQRQEAKEKLDKLADQDERPDGIKLSAMEKAEVKLLGRAILDGDAGAVENLMKVFGSDPKAMSNVMKALETDLKGSGVHLQYSVGDMMIGGDDQMHPVGSLTVMCEGVNRYVQFSTDKRLGPGVGGPVRWDSGEMARHAFMAFNDSPDAVLGQMGDKATLRLVKRARRDAPIEYLPLDGIHESK